MTKKICVIGSNSFSGASFVDYALEKGHEVIGISRSPEAHHIFLPYKWNKSRSMENFLFYQLDMNNDLDSIISLVKDFKPCYIVNFAAQSMVGQSWEHPEHWFTTNVVSTIKLHDKLRSLDFIKRYIHISTPEVYGSCSGLVKESVAYNPSTPYAVSRAAADMSLMSFYNNYNFPVVFTRAANVYGPGQQLYRIIPRTILFIKLGKKLQLHGGGHSVRSFIHIRDVCEGTLLAAQNGTPPDMFHFATENNISIRELVQLICKMMSVKFEDIVEISDDRPGKDAAYMLDSTKARTKLSWKDEISLEAGIDETIAWVESNIDEIKKQPLDYIHKP